MLLGSWLIIGVSDQGKINQGESWGMFGAPLFTHRPRWMKLHLSVFSCITPKLVVYSFFFLSLALSVFSLLSLPLPSFMCHRPAKEIQWWKEKPVSFLSFPSLTLQPAALPPAICMKSVKDVSSRPQRALRKVNLLSEFEIYAD